MASRMMHMLIGEKVAQRLGLPVDPEYILGSIATDAVYERTAKKRSHFYQRNTDMRTHVDIAAFLAKYESSLTHPFMLGYMTHLIADDVWLKDIYYHNNLHLRMRENPDVLSQAHDDFRTMNGKLVQDYQIFGLKDVLESSRLDACPVDEVALEDLIRFKGEALQDFTVEPDLYSKALKIYNYEEIRRYFEHAADAATEACRAILSQTDRNREE